MCFSLTKYTIIFRYQNLTSIRGLVYKRGYGKLNKQRIALTDNSVVEQVCDSLSLYIYIHSFCWPLCNCTDMVFIHRLWESTESSAWKISFTRSSPLARTSRKPTTSCGHSSSRLRWEASRRRGTTTSRVVTPETVRTTSTSSSVEWTRFKCSLGFCYSGISFKSFF